MLLLCICLAIGARNAKPEPFDAMNYHPYAAPYVPIIIRVLIDQNMITRGEDLKLILLFKKHNFSGKKYIEDNYSVFDQPTSITCDIECYSYTHSKEKRTVWIEPVSPALPGGLFSKKKCVYLLLTVRVFVAAQAFSLAVASGGCSLAVVLGRLCCRAQALGHVGSVVGAHGLRCS